MEVGNHADNKTAKKICLWLEGALQAERQSFALALDRRHCMLVEECMKQHTTMFMQAAGVPKEAALELQAQQQSIAEEGGKANAEQQAVKDAQADSRRAPSEASSQPSSSQPSPAKSLQNVSSTQLDTLPKRRSSRPDELRQPSSVQTEQLEHPAEIGEPIFGESEEFGIEGTEAAGTMLQKLSGKRATIFGENKNEYKGFLHALVKRTKFELFFVCLIVANTIVMALESQYDSFGMGLDVGYPGYNRPADEVWPGMKSAFTALDLGFGIAFSVELLLKICGLRLEFCYDGWNIFDSLIVLGWCVDAGARGILPLDLMMFRLARLARLLRLLKVLRTLKGIDPLFLMITTLKGSMSILVWVFILMVVVQTMFALLMNQVLVSFYLANDNNADTEKEVFKYFGSFSKSMLSMFEFTMGNWVPIARLLVESVSEWFLLFVIAHKLSMGFAVLGVINGIFTQETFKVAACDDTLMMMQKARAMKVHTKRMQEFFQAADASGDGVLDQDEFRAILQNPEIRAWLAAQELDASDADNLYVLLDRGSHGLSALDVVKGVHRLKGAARSMDLTMLMHNHRQLKEKVDEIAMGQRGRGPTLDDQPVADFSQATRPPDSDLYHAVASFKCTKVLI